MMEFRLSTISNIPYQIEYGPAKELIKDPHVGETRLTNPHLSPLINSLILPPSPIHHRSQGRLARLN